MNTVLTITDWFFGSLLVFLAVTSVGQKRRQDCARERAEHLAWVQRMTALNAVFPVLEILQEFHGPDNHVTFTFNDDEGETGHGA
jgi:hypothetical protein